jgi:quercetin dioxygenase-like cupin family protein
MRILTTDSVALTRFGSHGVVLHHPLDGVALLTTAGPATLVLAAFEPGGVIGRHPATSRQALAVVSGAVEVWGGDGSAADLSAGQVVVFDQGEEHETRAITATTVAIMEWAGDGTRTHPNR